MDLVKEVIGALANALTTEDQIRANPVQTVFDLDSVSFARVPTNRGNFFSLLQQQ